MPEGPLRAKTSLTSRRSLTTRTPPPDYLDCLLRQITEIEDGIDQEDREAERMAYLYENTQRATIESRQRFLNLQKRWKLLLGKYDEIRDIRDKSKYDLQHAKSETLIFSEKSKKEAEKRVEKLDVLRKDKHEVEEDAAQTVKSLAEALVRGQASKTVAEAHALELDHIYVKHIGSQKVKSHDEQSIESLQKALKTVCEVVNRSETLGLEPKVTEVRLSDLIGFAHQFEMKMSSLESQVQSLSEAKHELELKCSEIHRQVAVLKANQFQSVNLMDTISIQMAALGFPQPMSTYNQLKVFLETFDFALDSDEVVRQDAFLASSYMTLNIVTRRIITLLDYILKLAGSHTDKIGSLVETITAVQKHGERLERAYTRSLTPTSSDRSEGTDPLDVDISAAPIFFREAFEDLPEWGLDVDSITRQASEMLLIRIFAIDPRLKPDLRSWKSSQLSIVPESLHLLFLAKLLELTHTYLRGRLSEAFTTMISLAKAVDTGVKEMETEINSKEMTEAQLSVLLEFRHMQTTGNPARLAGIGGGEGIRRAFEQKYKKLMVQQRAARADEDTGDVAGRGAIRKRFESASDLVVVEPLLTHSTEDKYATSLRKFAKSSAIADKASIRSPASVKAFALDSPSRGTDEIAAFAQVRAINVRIRSIRNSEKPQSSVAAQRYLPDLKSNGEGTARGTVRKSMKSIYSEQLSTKKKTVIKRASVISTRS